MCCIHDDDDDDDEDDDDWSRGGDLGTEQGEGGKFDHHVL